MKNKTYLAIALLISVAAHLLAIILMVSLTGGDIDKAEGDLLAVIAVDVTGDDPQPAQMPNQKTAPPAKITDKAPSLKNIQPDIASPARAQPTSETQGSSPASEGKKGEPGAAGSDKILAVIRAKIESKKEYPRPAKKMGIEGKPSVQFEIETDGSLKYVKLMNSCGETILDSAAVDTVKRAAPFPYYPKPISLRIRFDLD